MDASKEGFVDMLVGCLGWKWQAEGLEEDQGGDIEGGIGCKVYRGIDEGT